MQLGISTLGHLIDFTTSNKAIDLPRSLYQATESCLNYIEENGIEVIELVIEPQSFLRGEHKQNFIDLLSSYSVKKQIHGPYIDIILCSHNPTISQASIDAYTETYTLCKDLRINLMTIHPGIANSMIKSLRVYNKLQLISALNILIDSINDKEFILCLENMPKDTNIMLNDINISNIISSLNREELFLTYDTSHFYTNSGDVNILWEKFHEKIKNVHLVDNYTKEADPHPPLGTGKIDFEGIIEIINSFNYKGSLIIELSSAKGLTQSVEYIKRYI
jgi:sugar phosphate isomerase/epimerase